MTRGDILFLVITMLWGICNVVSYLIGGDSAAYVSLFGWLLLLVLMLVVLKCSRKFSDWYNHKV